MAHWAAVLIGFAGGSVAATLLSAVATHWLFHPVISVRLDKKRGSYGPVLLRNRVTGAPVHQAKYFRLYVENTGLSTIRDCCGYIIKLRKHTSKGESLPLPEVLDLGWAHKEDTLVRDIPPGAFFHMDVATLKLLPQGRKLSLPVHPTTLEDFFNERATYELEILVSADNARPCPVPVSFVFDPQSDELEFTPLNTARYPWWRFGRPWKG